MFPHLGKGRVRVDEVCTMKSYIEDKTELLVIPNRRESQNEKHTNKFSKFYLSYEQFRDE